MNCLYPTLQLFIILLWIILPHEGQAFYEENSNFESNFSEDIDADLEEYLYLQLTAVQTAKYVKSPYVDEEVWKRVLPYLLPENHPIKAKLDHIFSQSRVIKDRTSLKKAGFRRTKPGKWSRTIVTRHPQLKGYLVKLYTDDQVNIVDWERFKSRVIGAKETQRVIDKYGYQDIFVVPKKWIYPLPPHPSQPKSEGKNFVLVVEDMEILPDDKNFLAWKNQITPKELKAIYTVLEKAGLWDTVYPFNLPFTKEGKLAFIDTEFYFSWPIHFGRLSEFLSDDMSIYWKKFIAKKKHK